MSTNPPDGYKQTDSKRDKGMVEGRSSTNHTTTRIECVRFRAACKCCLIGLSPMVLNRLTHMDERMTCAA